MPPRRSSRAPSVSTEAPPAETLPAKRKRVQSVQANAEEKENVVKPASRTRRSSSVKPSAAPPVGPRKSTRSKPSLPNVAESDAEEQSDAPPPVKRARPSFENKAEGHVKSEPEEETDEMPKPKPTRGKRGVSVIKSTPAPEMDVDEEPPSKPASRRTSARATAVSSGSRTSVGSSKVSLSAQIEEEEAEGSQEEDIKPTKGRRAPAKSGKKASLKAVQSSDEDEMSIASEEYHDDDEKPARKGHKGKTPAARKGKGKAAAKQAPKAKVVEESDDEMEAPPPAQPRAKSSQAVDIDSAPSQMPAMVEEDEEERSLFDPPPLPAPSSLVNTVPEEPAGPKSRLVIHKMALINFKSYAGRQEIGPFHKVNIPIFNVPFWPRSYVKLFSLFLPLSAPTDPVNRTRLTPFYLSLDIGLLKCVKANSLSSSTIQPTIQTWMSAVLRCIFVIL